MASAEQMTQPEVNQSEERSFHRMEAAYDFLSSHHPFKATFQKVFDQVYDKLTLDKEAYGQRYHRQG